MQDTMMVVCPNCDAANRVPRSRIGEKPKCGSCKNALFTGQPIALNDATFDRHMSRSTIPLVVDFWAAWCGPCKAMAPAFAQAAQRLEPGYRLVKVDTEESPRLAARYGIRSIPTLVIFDGGQERARVSGAMDAASLERWVRSQQRS